MREQEHNDKERTIFLRESEIRDLADSVWDSLNYNLDTAEMRCGVQREYCLEDARRDRRLLVMLRVLLGLSLDNVYEVPTE